MQKIVAIIFILGVFFQLAFTNKTDEQVVMALQEIKVDSNKQSSLPPEYDICILEQIPEFELETNELELIAMVTWNEAGNQSELGKRLVIDTILNRLRHSEFPKTISKIIHQPNQYSDHKSKVHDDILELVKEECMERTNDEVIFFQRSNYSSFGDPLLVEGAHYFNTLKDKEVCDDE